MKRSENDIEKNIEQYVHTYYWDKDINCARTILLSLGKLFDVHIEKQTLNAAIGLHGAGGYRAQCGLVEGGLMFLGILGANLGMPESEIVDLCYLYADNFKSKFMSLECYDLRASGFSESDPPHMCENLTCKAVQFAYAYVLSKNLNLREK
jgi:hypothetical protein